jgi:hypothetical protein
LIAIILGGMAGLTLLTQEPPEPDYQGKSLSAWLGTYKFVPPTGYSIDFAQFDEMTNAVMRIGTNGIPTLLRMLRANDSRLKLKFIELASKQHIVKLRFQPPAFYRNYLAVKGFESLGANASNAVPEIIAIYDQNISEVSRDSAVQSLAGIGPAAQSAAPAILRWISNSKEEPCYHFILALKSIQAPSVLVLPVFIKSLKHQDSEVRLASAFAIQALGRDAKPAVPALLESLSDPDPDVRIFAINALKQIDPEAAAKAGIK